MEYCHSVRCGKTRMVGLPDGRKSFRICVTGYTQYRRVTDGRTDRRTDILPRHSPRYAYASRGKNDTGTVNLVPCHIVGCCQIEFNNIFPVLSRIILLTDTARSHTATNTQIYRHKRPKTKPERDNQSQTRPPRERRLRQGRYVSRK